MLSKVEVRNEQGQLLTLPLQDYSQGYVIQEIEGLEPVKATLVSSSFANLDGEQYQSSRREKRNMIIKLDYKPDYVAQTVQNLRQKLYSFFMPKSNANFTFYSDDFPTVTIDGTIEDFNNPLFTDKPEAAITIQCFKPDFFEPTEISFPGNTTAGLTEVPLQYDGTVETGIKFQLQLNRSLSEFTIYHRAPDGIVRNLEFVAPMLSGDVIDISTVSGSKGATLTRGGSIGSILYGISPYSNWINLFPGQNKIRVYAEGAAIPFTIKYTNKYGGL